MAVTKEQKKAYLKAIGFSGKLQNNITCLDKIVRGHILKFPYETINVHASEYDLTPEKRSNLQFNALFNKLVRHQRGGRCVELNMLLQMMLTSFGFNVMPILPDTLYHAADLPIEQRPKHSAAIVFVQGKKFLVDAGFGGLGMLAPVPLQPGTFHQFSEQFRITKSSEYEYEFSSLQKGAWTRLYGFNAQAANYASYAEVDQSNKNPLNPSSYFKHIFICTVPFLLNSMESGRKRIFNNLFTITKNGKLTHQEPIPDQSAFKKILKKYFGIFLKHPVRFSEKEMALFQVGIQRKPILHTYNTRLREKCLKIVQPSLPQQNPPVTNKMATRQSRL